LVSDLILENNIYYSDGPPVGDITGTLRNGDLWVDSDDLQLSSTVKVLGLIQTVKSVVIT
jgi:hypothetical protein